MNRREFMKSLREQLSDMLEDERNEALEYYEDYLDEAGINEDDIVPESLGTPEKIVENIKKSIQNPDEDFIREENVQNPPAVSVIKKKISGLSNTEWILIIIIAVLTSPVWGSAVIGAGGVLIGIVAGIIGIFVGFGAAGIGMIAGGVACVVAGVITFPAAVGNGLLLCGVGAFLAGIGLLVTVGMINAMIIFVKWIMKICKKVYQKAATC